MEKKQVTYLISYNENTKSDINNNNLSKDEMKMNRGRKMMVEVIKINIDKEVAEKEFDIPKDFVLKPIKEMQNGNGPGIQIRVGGPGGLN